jgi:hypothetical protein
MTRADDRLLEFLSDEGPHSPTRIAEDERVGFGSEYIGRRLRNYLEPHGLVKNLGNGVYSITEAGEQYLAGELDAGDLERDDGE